MLRHRAWDGHNAIVDVCTHCVYRWTLDADKPVRTELTNAFEVLPVVVPYIVEGLVCALGIVNGALRALWVNADTGAVVRRVTVPLFA